MSVGKGEKGISTADLSPSGGRGSNQIEDGGKGCITHLKMVEKKRGGASRAPLGREKGGDVGGGCCLKGEKTRNGYQNEGMTAAPEGEEKGGKQQKKKKKKKQLFQWQKQRAVAKKG